MSNNPSEPSAPFGRHLPGFAGTLRGIGFITWKSQLIPRKLPWLLGILLLLPALIYATIKSPEAWAKQRASVGDADSVLNDFARRLRRHAIPLEQATRDSVARILSTEFDRAQSTWQEQDKEDPEARQKRLKDHINACYDKIAISAKAVLDEGQYIQFEEIVQRSRDRYLARAGEVLVPWSREEPFYHWLIDFYFFTILPLACVRACGPLIRDELQADTLGFLITRPIGRARLLIAKYIAQVASLEIVLLVETLLLFAAGASRQVQNLQQLLPLLLAVQILVVPAWSALGLFLGQITGRYMAMALVYGAVVEMGIGRIPTNINTLSIIRHLQTLLTHNAALNKIYAWPADEGGMAIAALLVAPVLFLGIATLLFTFVEYHHAAEMQK